MAITKPDEITSAMDFLQKISDEDVVLVKFKKKDGTDRIMKCTLNFARVPKEMRPKGVSLKDILLQIKKNKILRVFDLEKIGWRTIPFDRAEFLRTKDKMYSIKQVEDIFKK
jgi:hypothetical protein